MTNCGTDFVNTTKIDNAAPYAASKAATNIKFAKLAAAYEEQGILFMSLCPGLVDTTEGRTVTCEYSMTVVFGVC